MAIIRAFVLIIGLLAVAMGLLWIGQGTGLVMWPRESFMLAERAWAVNGAILTLAGLALIWLARRKRCG